MALNAYADSPYFLINVTIKSIMRSVIMLSVIMQSVIMLSVTMLSVIMLSIIMLSVIMLSIILLSVIMLSAIMLSVIMLGVIMLSVIYAECHLCWVSFMLSVIILSVMARPHCLNFEHHPIHPKLWKPVLKNFFILFLFQHSKLECFETENISTLA